MTDWAYRFTGNDSFPDPLEEIASLGALNEEGEVVYLMLNSHPNPPMSRAFGGDLVYLCTSDQDQLRVHGSATVVGDPFRGTTPLVVEPLYGEQEDRYFCPITNVGLAVATPMDNAVLTLEEQAVFLNGQATVRRIDRADEIEQDAAVETLPQCGPGRIQLQCLPSQSLLVVGLDPTAGTWQARMTTGPKAMPSFLLRVKPTGSIVPAENAYNTHATNTDFWNHVRSVKSSLVCIDGPCDTNGLNLEADTSGWNCDSPNGIRDGERQLAQQGVKLSGQPRTRS